MNSLITADFIKCFSELPREIQNQSRRVYLIWKANPSHPGLRFKPIQGHAALYSVRIGRGWRALGSLKGDTVTWFWIGSHAEYDQLVD